MASGDQTASPSPVEVVAAAGGIDVEGLAYHVEAWQIVGFHGAWAEGFYGESTARHLTLACVADAVHGEGECLECASENGYVADSKGRFRAQSRLLEHSAGNGG